MLKEFLAHRMVSKKAGSVISISFKNVPLCKTERKRAPNNGYFCMAGLRGVILVIMLPYFPIQKKKNMNYHFGRTDAIFKTDC